MTIAFPCESCGYRFEVDGGLAGKKCKCKHCGHVFLIPTPRTAPASPPQAAKAPARPEPRPAARSKPVPPPAADPYGLDDEDDAPPLPPRSAPRVLDDDDFVGPKPFKPVGSGSKKKKRSGSFLEGIPGWAYLAVLGVFALTGLLAFFSTTAATVFTLMVGLTIVGLWLVGTVGMLVVPFRESVACGLMYLFLPFYGLYYLVTRWDAMKPWFLTNLAAVGGFFLCALFLPAVAAARKAANEAVVQQQQQAQQQLADFAGVQPAPVPQAAGPEPSPAGPGPAPAPPGFTPPTFPNPNPNPSAGSGPGAAPRNNLLAKARDRANRINVGAAPRNANAQNPAETVTLNVTGLEDRAVRDAFRAKLSDAVRDMGVENPGLQSTVTRGLGKYTVWPIPDPQALADRIDFGKVISVEGRTITIQAAGAVAGRAPANRPAVALAGDDNGDPIDQALSLLSEPKTQSRKQGLQQLQRARVIPDRRAEVAKAIEPVLHDTDGFARADAAKALGTWGGSENVDALIAALRDDAFNVRWAVFDALEALHDPASAGPVANYLDSQQERGHAAKVLKAIGPEAEKAVIPYLDHRDVFTRVEACKILQAIGTQASIKPLQVMYQKTGGQGLDAMAANDAVRAIRSFNSSKKSGR